MKKRNVDEIYLKMDPLIEERNKIVDKYFLNIPDLENECLKVIDSQLDELEKQIMDMLREKS